MDPTVSVVRDIDDELVTALRELLRLLSPGAPALDRETLARVLAEPANTLLVAQVDGRVVGTLTLVMVPLMSSLRARIEDVVVADAARGRGIGAALTGAAVELARAAGAESVELTSRPSRVAANRLYRRLGFEQRETNAYRYPLR